MTRKFPSLFSLGRTLIDDAWWGGTSRALTACLRASRGTKATDQTGPLSGTFSAVVDLGEVAYCSSSEWKYGRETCAQMSLSASYLRSSRYRYLSVSRHRYGWLCP